MASGTGFFKGEKKKKKKDSVGSQSIMGSRPTFVLPKMIEKKKKAA